MKLLALALLLCASNTLAVDIFRTLARERVGDNICGKRAITVPGDMKCQAKGGHCININTCECSKPVVSGLCSGGYENKCCTTGIAVVKSPGVREGDLLSLRGPEPPTATTGKYRIPPFALLVKAYPNGATSEVKPRLGGSVNADWITNTCAIRMSHTLNLAAVEQAKAAGQKITPTTKNLVPVQPNGLSIKGGKQDYLPAGMFFNYIFRVAVLYPYVVKTYGPPTKEVSAAPNTVGINKAEFASLTGIIMFEIKWSDASGHFDLWDGSCMMEPGHTPETTRYFSMAKKVRVWAAEGAPVRRDCGTEE